MNDWVTEAWQASGTCHLGLSPVERNLWGLPGLEPSPVSAWPLVPHTPLPSPFRFFHQRETRTLVALGNQEAKNKHVGPLAGFPPRGTEGTQLLTVPCPRELPRIQQAMQNLNQE